MARDKRRTKRQKTATSHATAEGSSGILSSSLFNTNLLCDLLLVHCELANELLGFLDPHTIIKRLSPCCASISEPSLRAPLAPPTTLTWSLHTKQARESQDGSKLEISVKHTIAAFGCPVLSEYVSLRSQLLHLHQSIVVVEGDFGTITSAGEERHDIDCLVFPTPHCFRDPGMGVAGRVRERAGPLLDDSIKRQRIEQEFSQCGQVLCTSGFQTGMNLLVHCVGSPWSYPGCDALLYQAYKNALPAIDSATTATCTAVVSISTGRLQFPVEIATTITLRALRDMCFDCNFEAKIAFVCFEKPVLNAFERARTELLRAVSDASFVATH